MKKKRPVKNIWYEWLICYIPESLRISVGCWKDKILNASEKRNCKSFKKNTPKDTVYGREQRLSKSKNWIIKNPFISEENKEKK